MKALFIHPPDFQRLPAETPRYEMSWVGDYPPLGILAIATCVNEWTGHTSSVLDAAVLHLCHDSIKRAVIREKPDVVALSAGTFTLLSALKVARLVKEVDVSIPLVLGGIQASLFPKETIAFDGIDFLIRGEGEFAFGALLDALEGQASFADVPGLVRKQGNSPVLGKEPKVINDLDILPIPDRTLTPYSRYSSVFAEQNPVTTSTASRGCPYSCSFCFLSLKRPDNMYRIRTPERVVEEMAACADLGIKEIIFYDETFTALRSWTLKLCQLLEQADLGLTWDIRTRADKVDRELLTRMKRVGLRRVQIGVESGTQRILDRIHKNLVISQATESFKLVKEVGLESAGYFMIGFPGETREEMMKTIALARRLDPDYANFTLFTPLPETVAWNEILAAGDTSVKAAWDAFATHPTDTFDAPSYNQDYSKEELLEILNHAYRSFYLHPRFFLRELRRIRTPSHALITARNAVRILGGLVSYFWKGQSAEGKGDV